MTAADRSPAPTGHWPWYLAATLTVTAVSLGFLIPFDSAAQTPLFLVTNAAAVGAIAWGIRRHRPKPRAPWQVLLAAYGLLLAANTARSMGSPLDPLIGDPVSGGLYGLAYLAIAAGLVLMVRARGALRDLPSLADAIVAGIGGAIVWFEFLVASAIEGPGVVHPEQFTVALFPAPDLVFTILVLWLAFSDGHRGRALLLLGCGLAAQGLADGLLGLSDAGLIPAANPSGPMWLLSLGLVGMSALHPSMRRIGMPGNQRSSLPDTRRILVLAAVGLLIPLSLLRESLRVGTPGGVVFAIALIALIALLLVRVRGLFVDVGRYSSAMARLTETEARFRRLVEQVPAVIYLDATDAAVASQTASRYVSPRWKDLTGHSPEAASAHYWLFLEHVHPDDRERVVTGFTAANDQGGPEMMEYRVIAADGRVLWVRDRTVVTVRDAAGRACAWQGVLIDITEARRADDEIRRLNEELEQRITERTAELSKANEQLGATTAFLDRIVSAVPVVLYQRRGVDRDSPGTPEYFSAGVEQVLGFTQAEVIAPGFWPDHMHPDDRDRVLAEERRSRRDGLPGSSIEYRMLGRDGQTRWLHDVVRREYDADGSWRSIGAAIDITERKDIEHDLGLAKEEAELANRAKSEFLSSMSHELRTPLNAVLGFGQLLELSPLTPENHESVHEIVKAGRNLLAMIDSVLNLARIEAGHLTLSIEPVNVAELVAEAVDLVRPMAVERGIRFELPSPDDAAWALADRSRLGQVILNLVSNAVTFNRDGGTVTVITERLREPDRFRLAVTDTGPGIPPTQQALLFTPFNRAPRTHGSKAGLGVGLVLCARTMVMMGGTIAVQSEVGQGSTFTIELVPIDAPRGNAVLATTPPVRTPDATVLYVEDNLVNVALIERVLARRPGIRLLAAMQGSFGLELARRHHPNLVLLDINLPDIGGDEVLAQLRADPITAGIPVVVLSSAGDGARARLRSLGARAYLAKPIDIDLLLRTIDSALDTGGGRG